jgi:hypothetical protein
MKFVSHDVQEKRSGNPSPISVAHAAGDTPTPVRLFSCLPFSSILLGIRPSIM